MKIFDLTQGKYNFVSANIAEEIEKTIMDSMKKHKYPNDCFLYHRFATDLWEKNLLAVLQEVPVFIVETAQAGGLVTIPGHGITIDVPEDDWKDEDMGEFDFEKWFNDKWKEITQGMEEMNGEMHMKDFSCGNTQSSNTGSKGTIVGLPVMTSDCLGVHIYTSASDLIPRKIFVWADKIEKSAKNDPNNSIALFRNVVLHEIGHALMDDKLYNVTPSKFFSRADCVYRFIEEAMANTFALMMDYTNYTPSQQQFIEDFITHQPQGYNEGFNIYNLKDPSILTGWMATKVIFSLVIENIRMIWENKCWECLSYPLRIMPNPLHFMHHPSHPFMHGCGKASLFYVRGSKMGHVEEPTHTLFDIHNRTSKFTSFSDDEGRTWGTVNETGKMIVPAHSNIWFDFKHNTSELIPFTNDRGRSWGVVNENLQIIVPAQYEEIKLDSDLGNGKFWAEMNGKWGLTDIKAQQFTPFKYDFVWGFDESGLCMVRIDKHPGYLYGFVNKAGIEQIPVEYDYLYYYYQDRTIAKYKGKYYIIDKNNNRLVDLSTIGSWKDIRNFSNKGIAAAENSNGKWGGIDYNGNIVISCMYNSPSSLPL